MLLFLYWYIKMYKNYKIVVTNLLKERLLPVASIPIYKPT